MTRDKIIEATNKSIEIGSETLDKIIKHIQNITNKEVK